jgi:1-acyl-sn-glycerol-3-phosphate acyltransferase
MTALRALAYNLGFWLLTLVIAGLGMPTMLFDRRWALLASEIWTAASLGWLRISVGLTHEVRGRENLAPGAVIVAIKHQSAFDTLILNSLMVDPAIVLKRELLYLPVLGPYFTKIGMIPVDRNGGARALKAMVAMAKGARDAGRPIAIFPEGTRGAVGARLPFQPGVAALYSQLGLPIVPVALNSGLFWGRQAFLKRPGRIVVEILPAIPPGLDRRVAMALLEERISTATDRLVAAAQGDETLSGRLEPA